MLRTSADRLDRRPHITLFRKKIPASRQEAVCRYTAAFVNGLKGSSDRVRNSLSPDDVPVAFYHGARVANLAGLVRIQGCVNSTVDYSCSALAQFAAEIKSAMHVRGVDANSHDIARIDGGWVELFQGFVGDYRIPIF